MGETNVDATGSFAIAARAPATLPEHSLEVEALASSAHYRHSAPWRSRSYSPFICTSSGASTGCAPGRRSRSRQPASGGRRRSRARAGGGRSASIPSRERPQALPGLTAADLLPARWYRNEYSPVWRDSDRPAVEVAAGVMLHGGDGKATVEIPGLPPGLYRVEVSTDDGAGGTLAATGHAIVLTREGRASSDIPWVLSSASNELGADQPWQILVHCAERRQPYILEHFTNGHSVARSLRRGSSIESFPNAACEPANHELRMWFVHDFELTAADSPWNVNCYGYLQLDVEDAGTDGLRIRVADLEGRPLRAGEVQAFAVFAPPEDEVARDDRETPEPWLLRPRGGSLVKLESSLGEAKGTVLWLMGPLEPTP